MSDNSAWLEGLKVGDPVFVSSRHGLTKAVVVSVTKMHIVAATKSDARYKFRRSTGVEVTGDAWCRYDLEEPNKENVGKYKLQLYKSRVVRVKDQFHLQDTPDTVEGCEAILEALKPFIPDEQKSPDDTEK